MTCLLDDKEFMQEEMKAVTGSLNLKWIYDLPYDK